MDAFRIVFRTRAEKRLFYGLLICILGSWMYMYSGIFSVVHLGHDEAGQIWISKGLNHHSPIDSPEAGLYEVYQNNNTHNLDPGLFSYLLHFWMKLGGDGYLWLKALPMFFFGVFLFFLYHLVRSAFGDPIAPLLVLGLFPLSNVLLTTSINIRPYSLEFAFAYGLIYFLYRKHHSEMALSPQAVFITGMVGALLLWSRYTFSITILFVVSYLLLLDKADNRQKLLKLTLFSAPIFISLVLIYFFVLRFQNSTFQAPALYHGSLVRYQGFFYFFKLNFLSIRAIPFTILLIVLTATVLNQRTGIYRKTAVFLLVLFFSIQLAYLFYSATGMSPWSIRSTRSAHLIIFSLMGGVFLWSVIRKNLKLPLLKNLGYVIMMLGVCFVCWNKFDYRHSFLYQLLDEFELQIVPNLAYSTLIPEFKYLCLKGVYPYASPEYSSEIIPEASSYLLEDSRMPSQLPKTMLYQSKTAVRPPVLFEIFDVHVIQLKPNH